MKVTVRKVALGPGHPEVFAIVALAAAHLEVWVNSDHRGVDGVTYVETEGVTYLEGTTDDA